MTALPPSCPRCGYDLLATAPPPPPATSPAFAPPAAVDLPRYPAPLREPAPRRTGLGAASVPRILLGLGATCLLVAALIFLAVAWSWLGIGGRTAVLVTLTAASAAAGQWLARRGLRVAAESLTVVALGLLVLDLVGARDAGWLPVSGDGGFVVVVGAALLAASLALSRLVVAQLVAPCAVALVALGAGVELDLVQAPALGAVLGCAALTLARRPVLRWTALAVGLGAWIVLLGWSALVAADHPSLSGLWVEGHGWWLLVAALVPAVRRLGVPVAATLVSGVVALPVLDEGQTALALAAAGALAGWGLVARRWPGGRVPAAMAALVLLPTPLALVVEALASLSGVIEERYAHPLVLPVAVLAALVAAPWRPYAATAALWLAGVLTLTSLWTGAPDLRAFVVIGAAGVLALALPRLEAELPAWLVGAGALAAFGDSALHLTLAGTLVTASALVHRDRRLLGWAGGLLLAAATWVRLAELGVRVPEPYTLPAALVLVALGVWRLRRDPDADTLLAVLPGLALATVPSLLWALGDPVSPRAAVLGLACLVLLVAGSWLRWSAPVLVGAVVGGLLVLREAAPYAAETPQWVLIGTAGTLLMGVGTTWEARLRDLRTATGYLGRLR